MNTLPPDPTPPTPATSAPDPKADSVTAPSASSSGLSHFDDDGRARMVDVGDKAITSRRAIAVGQVLMQPATLAAIVAGTWHKGDVLQIARIAGIQAAKRTGELIPLCHPLPLDAVRVDLSVEGDRGIRIEAEVAVTARTGVEMEALTAVTVAALTVYDMVKSIDRQMSITEIRLEAKSGGRSGDFRRSDS